MNRPIKILLATENTAKVEEMTSVIERLTNRSITVIGLRDLDRGVTLPEEVGSTFCEIATSKAQAAMDASGLPSIGDDSGLCVDVLEGAPGIKSRRWAGENVDDSGRNAALIYAVSAFPPSPAARFVTCVALCLPGEAPVSAIGECRGHIVGIPRGNNGFGYDPIFEVENSGLTMAELDASQKNKISHRAIALQNLFDKLSWSAR
jgi:XTP/dITP diphosphohydrolase